MHSRLALTAIVSALTLSASGIFAAEEKADATKAVSSEVRAELAKYEQSAETELRDDILKFWLAHTRDRERGGFYGEISNDLVVKKNAPRGALLSSRILWTFSAAYRRYHDPAYLEMAKWAYDDLTQRFWDNENGGLYWTVTADGKPLNTSKQTYGQAFGLYSLAEYYRASGDKVALEKSIAIYRLLEAHARDPKFGGYWELFDRSWNRQTSLRGSALEPIGSKSQNTHLHILEAFTNLLRAWPDDGLKKSQREVVELMLTKIIHPKTHHLVLFLNDDWSPVSTGVSYGHDIEASWLLTEAGDVLGDEALSKRIRTESVAMAEATLREGVDDDGSLLYEKDERGLNTNREWWPQAEAAVGFFNAYQLSGDEKYQRAAFRVWDYIQSHLVDRKNGEWFRSVTKDGKISTEPKVSLWKCPYHNGRSCLELAERIKTASGGAVGGW